jgi:hypothetical protein
MPRPHGPPSTTLGLTPSTYTPVQLRGGGGGVTTTPPSIAVDSHHCVWPNLGQPSLHATVGTDPDLATNVRRPAAAERVSMLDAPARLVGSAVTGQILQHDDAPNAHPHLRSGSPTPVRVRRTTPHLIPVTSLSFDHLILTYLLLLLLATSPFYLSPQ